MTNRKLRRQGNTAQAILPDPIPFRRRSSRPSIQLPVLHPGHVILTRNPVPTHFTVRLKRREQLYRCRQGASESRRLRAPPLVRNESERHRGPIVIPNSTRQKQIVLLRRFERFFAAPVVQELVKVPTVAMRKRRFQRNG